jgi:hypothetical protein
VNILNFSGLIHLDLLKPPCENMNPKNLKDFFFKNATTLMSNDLTIQEFIPIVITASVLAYSVDIKLPLE